MYRVVSSVEAGRRRAVSHRRLLLAGGALLAFGVFLFLIAPTPNPEGAWRGTYESNPEEPVHGGRYAISTLVLSPNYVATAMKLCFSLRKNWPQPEDVDVVALVGDDVDLPAKSEDALRCCFDEVLRVTPIRVHIGWALVYPRLATQFTKLRLWEETNYRRLIYLDADTTVVDPPALEALLRSPVSFGSVPAGANLYNGGVLLLEPAAAAFAGMFQKMESFLAAAPNPESVSEQDFLTLEFRGSGGRAVDLPVRFNVATGYERETHKRWEEVQRDAVVYHFLVGKPWFPFTWGKPYDIWRAFDAEARKTCGHDPAEVSWWNVLEGLGAGLDRLRWLPFKQN
jgi:hypothetical protein